MPRRPERYQLPLEFGQAAQTAVEVSRPQYNAPDLLVDSAADAIGGRFVRMLAEPVAIRDVVDIGEYLLNQVYTPFEQFDQEELWVHLLNVRHYLVCEALVYRGSVNTIGIIRAAEVFKPAVRINASALILSHVHPSGDCEPSPEDLHTTTSLVEAGRLLGISILDHLIVGSESWVSLREQGLDFSD